MRGRTELAASAGPPSAPAAHATELHLESRMRDRVHVRIEAGGTLAEHRRHHRHHRCDQRLIAGDAQQGDNRVRRPGGKPQRNDRQHNAGQLDFGALAHVLVRADLLGGGHRTQNVIVAVRDDGERQRPGAHEEHEHKDARPGATVQIVKAAAGQKALGHVATEADVEGRHNGKADAVHPDDQNH